MQKQLAAFVEAIRQSGLIRPEQVDQIVAWASAPDADPQVVAREIATKGWLTAFQLKMFWKGRSAELFLNQYVLIERLGEGGMGEVFRAKHRRMDRDVALKVIRKDRLNTPEAVRRFQREIEAAAQLAHENVVMAYDADKCGDRHFFAMEFVDGTNLAKLVRDKGPMPVSQACDCIRQAAMGLQHAFERGMVHRDIKPSNLLLGKGGVVKILDMGLARLQESPTGEVESRITQEGLVIGTPDFLAPEQARNARTADIRADIYALGCSLYYLLVGETPYPAGTPTEKLLRHSTDPLPPILRSDVSRTLEAIVHKMMAKRMEDRYQTPGEAAFALQPFCGNLPSFGTGQQPPTPPQPPTRSAPRATPYNHLPPEAPQTDSQFRLPPPAPRRKTVPERTRWNLPVAIAVGIVALTLAGVAIYKFFPRKDTPPLSGPSLETEFKNKQEMNFVLLQAGSFEMGSTEAEDEKPVHTVEISKAFYMSTTEVTIRQYQAAMGPMPKNFRGSLDDLDVPMSFVTIGDALSFCRKLNADPDKKVGWEYRLPTEAEWEYACRAGSRERFAFGNDLGREQALFDEKGRGGPGKVGQFAANAWGLFDMHGNVAEWVADQYDEKYYASSPAKDPTGASKRAKIVIRGGSYADPKELCRSSKRRAEFGDNVTVFATVGFRVVFAPKRE